jgi:hypothetical protein
VERAEDLPALLAAAYLAFDYALQALRGAEDNAGPLLPAFVLAAAAAADGRDAVAAVRSFAGPGPALMENMASPADAEVADQVARLSFALFTRLRDAATGGGGSACAAAAAAMREYSSACCSHIGSYTKMTMLSGTCVCSCSRFASALPRGSGSGGRPGLR